MSTISPIISTTDLEPLVRFYTELLGAKQTARYPEDGATFFVGLRVGDSDLGLVVDDRADTAAPQRLLISIDVDDVDKLLERVEALGGQVLGAPNDMPWGHRVAHVKDPDGNAVNLTQAI